MIPTASIHPNKGQTSLVRIGVLQNIFETAIDLGFDLTSEFARRGLTRDLLEQGDTLFNVSEIATFLDMAAQSTECSDFALRLASRQDASFLGSIGLLMQTAPTLGEALRKLGQYIHAHAQPVSWAVQADSETEKLKFALDLHGMAPNQHRLCAELALAQCYNVIATIIGGRPSIERVYFTRAKLFDAATYTRYFHAPVEFNSDFYGFEFAPGTLAQKVIYSDRSLHKSLRQHLSAPDLQAITPLDRQVRNVIRSLLPTQLLSIERVAKSFGCDKRTLQRWLKNDYRTSYHELVDEVRFDLAKQYLSQSNMSVTNLSFAVGYSDPTNFTRAFKKALGCTPRQWRQNNAVRHV